MTQKHTRKMKINYNIQFNEKFIKTALFFLNEIFHIQFSMKKNKKKIAKY